MCNSKTKTHTRQRKRDIEIEWIQNLTLISEVSLEIFLSNLEEGGEVSSYRRFNLASLQDKLDKREIPPYTCMEGGRVGASYHSWHKISL